MVNKKKQETKRIALNLVYTLIVFFVALYISSIILVATFGIPWNELPSFPFKAQNMDFKDGLFRPLISICVAFLVAMIFQIYPIRDYMKAWDYICSTALIYFIIVCGVSRNIPKSIGFYIVLFGMCIISIGISTLVNFCND